LATLAGVPGVVTIGDAAPPSTAKVGLPELATLKVTPIVIPSFGGFGKP
jgi:hypothetical protein